MKRNCIPILVWLNILMLSTVGFCGCTPDSPTDTPAAACDDEDLSTYYRDGDGDSFGDSDDSVIQCAVSKGYVVAGGDCDDSDVATHPGAIETCDTIDNNCDGNVDEGLRVTYYLDDDGDGYGDSTQSLTACIAPSGYVLDSFDCNDNDAAVYPWAEEICDSVDNNCDGTVDEDLQVTYYLDDDGDGYGDSTQSLAACIAPSGYVIMGGDCNETDAAIHPGATETCDTIDNNCDGSVDEDLISFLDDDGDGFGTGDPLSCQTVAGYSNSGGDCDDNDPAVYPAAPDTEGDGLDSSCDGTDGLAPSVGLHSSTFTTLQAALDAASEGQTIWVGPGTYREYGLTFHGKAVTLRSTAGETKTFIDGQSLGTVFYFQEGEQEDTVLEGFTIQGGKASKNCVTPENCSNFGGGIFILDASPTLTHLNIAGNKAYDCRPCGGGIFMSRSNPLLTYVTVENNTAENESIFSYSECTAADGGGIYLSDSSPTLTHVTLSGNRAIAGYSTYDYGMISHRSYSSGGGMALEISSPLLTDVTLSDNWALAGGGMSLTESSPTLSNVAILGNAADSGGGMKLFQSSPSLSSTTISGNQASSGGGAYLFGSEPVLSNVTISHNTAYSSGGGLLLSGSAPLLSNITMVGNMAGGYGGGMYLLDSSPTLTHMTIVDNMAEFGGGIYLKGSTTAPVLKNDLFAYNFPDNLSLDPSNRGAPTLSYCNLFSRTSQSNHNLSTLDPTNLSVDPAFVFYTPNRNAADDDLHLMPDSPLRDAGDPTTLDGDGSGAEIGAYGGAVAAPAYDSDSDLDGLYDGWEQRFLGGLASESAEDTDADGLSNGAEFTHTTLPNMADTDGDGWTDGEEIDAGSDPVEPSSQPGHLGGVVLRVPDDFSSIQTAANRCWYLCVIEVAAGTYSDPLRIAGMKIALQGAGADLTILKPLQSDSGVRMLTVTGTELTMDGFTITGNYAYGSGAGLFLNGVTGTLQNLIISENIVEGSTASFGGGIYLMNSNPLLANISLVNNQATAYTYSYSYEKIEMPSYGGGIYLLNSSPTLQNVALSGHFAQQGGGIFLMESSPSLKDVTLSGNVARSGAGMLLQRSNPTLSDVTFSGNMALGSSDYTDNAITLHGVGGGMFLEESNPSLTLVTFSKNSAYTSQDHGGGGYGGGMYLHSSSPQLNQVTLEGNDAEWGGGLYLDESNPSLNHVALVGNWGTGFWNNARWGGGMTLADSNPVLTHVIFSGNQGGGMLLAASSPTLRNSVLSYNTGYNLSADSSSNPVMTFANVFNPPDFGTDDFTPTGTYTTVEPQFLAYADSATGDACAPGSSTTCLPDDLHLAFTSPLINAGDPSLKDPDGSRSDIGIYGSPDGDGWDLDGDGYFDYFWPGEWADAPSGFDETDYDCDDLDESVQACL